MPNARPKPHQPSICIIGAGPAGLSAAWFLKERGYRNVIVLERESRVGGKCYSVTVQGKSFDLGANYITSAYKQVKRLARLFGANMYTEGSLRAYDYQSREFTSLFKAVVRQTSLLKLGWLSLLYMFKRWRLCGIISPRNPGYKNISSHPELCQPFDQWLKANGLANLAVLFQIPITLMGYGKLSEISTAYALTYMSNATFMDLVLAAVSPGILGYPKRFTEGYQRLWDRISWQLEVKNGAEVTRVTRGEKVIVEYRMMEEHLGNLTNSKQTLACDYLVVATPLIYESVSEFLSDMTEQEKELFKKVTYDPFIVTTYNASGLENYTAATFMIPEPPYYQPTVITRQFADNDLVSIYTRTPYGKPVDKNEILTANKEFVFKACNVELPDYYTYSEFPYFPHVSPAEMGNQFYDRFESMQGKNKTFYVGGLMNFELVETIVNYSRVLVERNFKKLN
jgi:hypothetical protein